MFLYENDLIFFLFFFFFFFFFKGLCALTTFKFGLYSLIRRKRFLFILFYFIFGLSKKSAADLTKKLISSSPRPNLLLTVNDNA